MTASLALGWSGFRQLVRSRVYVNLIVAGLVMVAAALVLDQLAGGQTKRVLVDLGLWFISLVVAVTAGVLAVVSVTRDIESKQIHLVLARPISRASVVVGRFLAVAMLVLTSTTLLGAVLALTLVAADYQGGERAMAAAMFGGVEGLIVAAIAMAFGTGSSSTVSAVFTATVFAMGRLTDALGELIAAKKFSGFLEAILAGIHRALPHLGRFDLSAWARGDAIVAWTDTALALAYGALYIVALLSFSAYRLSRRDLL